MLSSQNVAIPFGVGLQEKVQPELLEAGTNLLSSINLRIDKTGSYRKRHGYEAMTTVSPGVERLGQFRGGPIAFDGADVQSYSPETSLWINGGPVPEAVATRIGVLAAADMRDSYDVCIANGVAGIIYVKTEYKTGGGSQDQFYVSLFDISTGSLIRTVQHAVVAGSPSVRAIAVGNSLVFLYNGSSNNNLYSRIYSTTSPLSAHTGGLIATDIDTTGTDPGGGLDVCLADATHYFVTYRSTASAVTGAMALYTVGSIVPTSASTFANSVTLKTIGCGTNYLIDSDSIWIGTNGAAATVQLRAVKNATLFPSTAAGTALTVGGPPRAIVIQVTGTKTAIVAAGNSKTDRNVYWDTVDGGSGTTIAQNEGGTVYRFMIAGKFLPLATTGYLPLIVYDDTYSVSAQLEPTGVLAFLEPGSGVPGTARPVATFLARSCDTTVANPFPPATILDGTTPIAIYPQKQEQLGTSLDAVRFDFAYSNMWQNDEAMRSMPFAAGMPSTFDGQSATEIGFVNHPGYINLSLSVGAGSLPAGTYQYTAIYEWTTSSGELVQSAPCPTASKTVALNDAVIIKVPTLQLSYKGSPFSYESVRVSIYRTDANDTILYKITELYNSSTVSELTYTDTTVAATPGALLYTQPGTPGTALSKFCPPSATCMVVHRNRLWFVGDDGITVWYSGQFIDGEQPWFSDLFTFQVPKGGNITALESMDGVLYIFKRDFIFSVTGEGPVDNGAGNDLSTPEEMDIEVGCIDPRSIVVVPSGVLFQSPRGIYILSRSRTIGYMGQNVETTLESFPTILSADISDATGCILIEVATNNTTSSGTNIVYDYVHEAWMTDSKTSAPSTGANVSCGEVIAGTYYWSTREGLVFKESTAYTDDGRWISGSLKTAWVRMAGLQGFQRIRRVNMLLSDVSSYLSFGVNISAYKDYSSSTFQTWTWTDAEISALSGQRKQLQLSLNTQKLESLSIAMSDQPPVDVDPSGEGPIWLGMTFEVGVKAGMNKLPAENSK